MNEVFRGGVRSGPRTLLRLEALALFCLLAGAYAMSGLSWWLFAGLFFVPDIGLLGYLAGPRVGALAYNTLHTLVGPILFGTVGWWLDRALLPWVAVIWAAHILFDRAVGYGLKYATDFKHTHLGALGSSERSSTEADRHL